LRVARQAAAERFAGQPWPTDALEDWRYSRIDALDVSRYRLAPAPVASSVASPSPEGQEFVAALVAAAGRPAALIETHNGHLSQSHGSDRAVTVERLSAPDAKAVELGAVAGEPDAFAALNLAFAPAPVRVRVGSRAADAVVVVVHWADAEGSVLFPRTMIEVESGATTSVLEVVAGPGADLVVPVTELDVADAARLSYVAVQALGPEAWQIGLQASRVGRDSTLVSAAVALGGHYARTRTESALVAPGGDSRLLAVYFGAGQQMHDFRTVQHHQAPKTRSNLLYKGALANSSRSVYSGLIRVEKGARGANAFQTNRNLVLHEGAHADSVPNLEIEDNDVRCSHASAVGPIAPDQRFYVESRGVPPAAADRLIALGFLGEVVAELPIPGLAVPLLDQLVARLEAAENAEVASDRWTG
jgi:Fe-S cluster assembly protein SufD